MTIKKVNEFTLYRVLQQDLMIFKGSQKNTKNNFEIKIKLILKLFIAHTLLYLKLYHLGAFTTVVCNFCNLHGAKSKFSMMHFRVNGLNLLSLTLFYARCLFFKVV